MNDTLSVYERLGGETVLATLVKNFYQQMDTLPEAKVIRAMHEPDLGNAEQKLFWFLSGWLGGPDLYQQRFGHPFLRRRHLPFPIDESARDAWMLCMQKALEQTDIHDQAIIAPLMDALFKTADFMRNTQ